jgi:hypothetical protein
MVVPRRLDRSAKREVERPSLHDKQLIVERRSLRSALRASVETTESSYAIALLGWGNHGTRIVSPTATTAVSRGDHQTSAYFGCPLPL